MRFTTHSRRKLYDYDDSFPGTSPLRRGSDISDILLILRQRTPCMLRRVSCPLLCETRSIRDSRHAQKGKVETTATTSSRSHHLDHFFKISPLRCGYNISDISTSPKPNCTYPGLLYWASSALLCETRGIRDSRRTQEGKTTTTTTKHSSRPPRSEEAATFPTSRLLLLRSGQGPRSPLGARRC